nr:hypothetical protein [Tanacetum cinerariifolium]
MEDNLDDGDSLKARKLTVGKSKEKLELYEALDHESVIVNEESHRVVVFKKAPPRAYSKPFTRFSLPCDVDGQGAWDANLDMADSFNYMTEERFDQLVIGYANEGEPSVIFGRDFLVTSKSRVDFGIGEMRIDLTMLEEMKDIDVMFDKLVENLEEVGKLSRDNYIEEVKMRIVEHGLPKKMCDPSNFVLSVKVNGTIEMNALAKTGASVCVLPYCLFMNLSLGDPKPYNSNLTMADNTQAKAMGEVKNVRIQIRYQAYLVDFLILDIPVDKELPLLLGRPFLRTYGAVIDIGRDTLCIDNGVIRQTYFPKPRSKAYLDNFAQEEEDDWLSCFEVGRDEDGNQKYGPVAPSFLDIEDDMEKALAIEAYSNPFKNIIVFKKLVDFLGDEAWHAKFEVTTPSGREFTRMFKTKMTNRKLFGKLISKEILKQGQPTGWAAQPHGWAAQPHGWESDEILAAQMEGCAGRLKKLRKDHELNHGLFAIHFTKLEVDDKLFNHEGFWQKIGKPTSTNPRTSLIKEPLMRIVHKLLVRSLVHRDGIKEMCQKRDTWMMGALEESWGIKLAWVIAEHLCKHAPGLKENNLICGGHYVTKIAHSLRYLNEEEVAKCLEPIDYETWTVKMLANEQDEGTHTLIQTEQEASQPGHARRKRQEPKGLDSSWGDWNVSLNEIELRDAWRDSMLMRNNYILQNFVPILQHLADQSNFAYPTYEQPNFPPYPYPYVPYLHPYTHYPDTGSPSLRGDHYEAHVDGYHACSIVRSLGYEIGGSSAGFHGEDFNLIVHLEDCVESDDDEMRD